MTAEILDKILGLVTSKRFAALVLLLGLVVFGDRTGLDAEQRSNAVLGLGSFILAEGLRPTETKKASLKRIEAEERVKVAAMVAPPPVEAPSDTEIEALQKQLDALKAKGGGE